MIIYKYQTRVFYLAAVDGVAGQGSPALDNYLGCMDEDGWEIKDLTTSHAAIDDGQKIGMMTTVFVIHRIDITELVV